MNFTMDERVQRKCLLFAFLMLVPAVALAQHKQSAPAPHQSAPHASAPAPRRARRDTRIPQLRAEPEPAQWAGRAQRRTATWVQLQMVALARLQMVTRVWLQTATLARQLTVVPARTMPPREWLAMATQGE